MDPDFDQTFAEVERFLEQFTTEEAPRPAAVRDSVDRNEDWRGLMGEPHRVLDKESAEGTLSLLALRVSLQ